MDDSRLVHLRPDWESQARQGLAELGHAVLPGPLGRPCAWCGTARSTRWEAVELRWPDGTEAALCDPCARRWRRSRCHKHGVWRPYLAAEWLGLELATTELFETKLTAYFERVPDGRGTERRWQYVDTGN